MPSEVVPEFPAQLGLQLVLLCVFYLLQPPATRSHLC